MTENGDTNSREPGTKDWRDDGVRVIPGASLDLNTPQTAGMDRAVAINLARVGAQKIWAGTVSIHPDARTGAHHHGELESVIYVLRGRARMRWGARLEYVAEAGPGDFIFIPPYVPHQEINASADEVLECVLVRSGGETVVVNLDIEAAEIAAARRLGRSDPPAAVAATTPAAFRKCGFPAMPAIKKPCRAEMCCGDPRVPLGA